MAQTEFIKINDDEAVLYTDASYSFSSAGGTYACILLEKNLDCEHNTFVHSGKVDVSIELDPLVCEMTAILNGIKLAISKGYLNLTIHTDCLDCCRIANNMVCNSQNRKWFEKRLNELRKFCSIEINHVSRYNFFIKQAHNICAKEYKA